MGIICEPQFSWLYFLCLSRSGFVIGSYRDYVVCSLGQDLSIPRKQAPVFLLEPLASGLRWSPVGGNRSSPPALDVRDKRLQLSAEPASETPPGGNLRPRRVCLSLKEINRNRSLHGKLPEGTGKVSILCRAPGRGLETPADVTRVSTE